jgi:hypothetical protein
MRPRELSYRCSVCRWQGMLEPNEAGDAADCPQCGVLLQPLSWGETWGVALLIVGITLAAVVVMASVATEFVRRN